MSATLERRMIHSENTSYSIYWRSPYRILANWMLCRALHREDY
jgi:hypothetical protein